MTSPLELALSRFVVDEQDTGLPSLGALDVRFVEQENLRADLNWIEQEESS